MHVPAVAAATISRAALRNQSIPRRYQRWYHAWTFVLVVAVGRLKAPEFAGNDLHEPGVQRHAFGGRGLGGLGVHRRAHPETCLAAVVGGVPGRHLAFRHGTT